MKIKRYIYTVNHVVLYFTGCIRIDINSQLVCIGSRPSLNHARVECTLRMMYTGIVDIMVTERSLSG